MDRVKHVLSAVSLLFILAAWPVAGMAQDHLDVLIAEQDRMERYRELSFVRQEAMHHQASTILAIYGGYNSHNTEAAGANALGNDLQRLKNRLGAYWPQTLAGFKRDSAKDKLQRREEAAMAEEAASLMAQLFAAGAEVAALCEANKPYEASLVYRDKSMPLSAEITRLLYTLNSEANARFQKAALKAKYQ